MLYEIGTTPYGEDCAQVGSPGYAAKARKECRVYINQLIRLHGTPPAGCSLIIKSSYHDFGTYYEVNVKFEDTPEGNEYAAKCEGEGPELWDEEAKKELHPPVEDQPKEKIPTVGVPMTLDSIVDVECPFCGAGRTVEPDANYLVKCECGRQYQLRSEI